MEGSTQDVVFSNFPA